MLRKDGSLLSSVSSKGQAEEELSGEKRPGLWGTPASHSQYGEASSIGFALSCIILGATVTLTRDHGLFLSLDQIRDHDLLTVINIA